MAFAALGVIAGIAAGASTTALVVASLAATALGTITKSKELVQFGAGLGLAAAGSSIIGALEAGTAEAGAGAAIGEVSAAEASAAGAIPATAVPAGAIPATPMATAGAAMANPMAGMPAVAGAAPEYAQVLQGIPASGLEAAGGLNPAATQGATTLAEGYGTVTPGLNPYPAGSMAPGTTVAPEVAEESMKQVSQAGGFDAWKADAIKGSGLKSAAAWAKENQLIAYGLIQMGGSALSGAMGANVQRDQLKLARDKQNWQIKNQQERTTIPPDPATYAAITPNYFAATTAQNVSQPAFSIANTRRA